VPIFYIPNDPEARKAAKPRRVAAARKRGGNRSDFAFDELPRANVYASGSDEFLGWQCREALLRALAMWETIAGPLAHWQGRSSHRKLRVVLDQGEAIDAYYDRSALRYFHATSSKNGRIRRFAASVDVVAHEAGHAFLDAIRPSLWDSNFPEPNAFHEAFGDCIAILTALWDTDVRKALLKRDPRLSRANFVETLMESLANAIRDEDPDHNAAKPRRGRNRHRWTLPTTLPDDGGPDVLINEVHSFGQVFVGCFYDAIRNVFLASKKNDSAALARAAEVVGKLLVRAADKAPHTPRFFQAVGRAMTLEDEAIHRGQHHEAIRLAFRAHGIMLGSVAAVAPRAELRGAAPRFRRKAKAGTLAKATLDDLKARLSLPKDTRMSVRTFRLGGQPIAEACHVRPVPLEGISERLENVIAYGVEPALVGSANRHAAVLGALPDARMTEDEVRSFVHGLLKRGSIAFDARARRGGRGAVAGPSSAATHGVVRLGGKLVLKRLRFACGCGRVHAGRRRD
jgi:hypothetical protein